MNFFKNLIFLVTAPSYGWQTIGKYYVPISMIQKKFLYPLIGLLSLSSMAKMFYLVDYTLLLAIVNVFIYLVAYVVTYFAALYLVPFFLQSLMDNKDKIDRYSIFVTYNLSFLIVLGIIRNVLPSEFLPLLYFHIYVIYIMQQGLEYIKYNENPFKLIIPLGILMIVFPILIIMLLNKIL